MRSQPEHTVSGTAQHPMPQNTTAHPHTSHQNPTAVREAHAPQGSGAANGGAIRHDPTVSQSDEAEALPAVRQECVSPSAAAGTGKSTIGQRMMAQTAQSEAAAVHSGISTFLRRERAAEKRSLQKTRVTDISSLTGHTHTGAKKTEDGQKKHKKQKNAETVVTDEGGNTVVSVVKAVIYMIFVVVVSVFLAVAIIMVGNDVFAFVKTDTAIPVTIPEYASLNDVIDILYQNGNHHAVVGRTELAFQLEPLC